MSHGRSNSRLSRAPVSARPCRAPPRPHLSNGNPLRIGPPTLEDAATWHARGVDHECAGRLNDAIACYRTALSVGGPDGQIIFDLAYALAEAGQRQAAIERYRQLLELDPSRSDAWINLGDLLIAEGEIIGGADALRRAVQLVPHDPAAHYNLADGLDALAPDEAADHWRIYLAIGTPSDERAAYARRRLAGRTEPSLPEAVRPWQP